MKNLTKQSIIGTKISLRVIFFSSVITLFLTSIQLYIEFKNDFNQVAQIQSQIESSYLGGLETAVWGINNEQVKSLLKGIVALPTVIKASVVNEAGSEYISYGSTDDKQKHIKKAVLKLYSPTEIKKSVIATLTIFQSHEYAYHNLKKRLLTVLFANFIKTFLVALFILYMFHAHVSRHLINMSTYLQKATLINDKEMTLDRPKNSNNDCDELDILTHSFNKISHELSMAWFDLESSEKRYRLLAEGSLQGILIIDYTWDFLYGNERFFQILGLEKLHNKITSVKKYFTPESIKIVNNYLTDYKNNNSLFIEEITLQTDSNQDFFAQAIFTHTTHDEIPVLQIALFDISRLKALKEKQKKYELQLIQKNKMESIGVMLSGVTHEINNPNYVIKQNSVILAEIWKELLPFINDCSKRTPNILFNNLTITEINEIIPELVNDISSGSENISSIVRDLKSFIKQDKSNNVEVININDIIKNVVHMLRISIHKNCNNFQLNLADYLPDILGYQQRLHQVFINLIINALEALKTPSDAITISTFTDGNIVFVSIRDEGVGLQKNINHNKIFDAFFTTKTDIGGSGLGLAISQSIITQHHSEIKINTDLDVGVEFTIDFPTGIAPLETILGIDETTQD